MRTFDSSIAQYFWNVLYGVDQLVNALRGGDPNETLSSAMGKQIEQGKCRACTLICHVLNLFQQDHCLRAIERTEHPGERALDTAERRLVYQHAATADDIAADPHPEQGSLIAVVRTERTTR